MKHEILKECPNCTEKLMWTNPSLVSWFIWLVEKFPNAHIAWSYRDQAKQTEFYEKGLSRVKYPNSKHNTLDINGRPSAEALDLFQIIDGKAVFDEKWYRDVNALNEMWKVPLRWGGNFLKLKDFCHFELLEKGEKDV